MFRQMGATRLQGIDLRQEAHFVTQARSVTKCGFTQKAMLLSVRGVCPAVLLMGVDAVLWASTRDSVPHSGWPSAPTERVPVDLVVDPFTSTKSSGNGRGQNNVSQRHLERQEWSHTKRA